MKSNIWNQLPIEEWKFVIFNFIAYLFLLICHELWSIICSSTTINKYHLSVIDLNNVKLSVLSLMITYQKGLQVSTVTNTCQSCILCNTGKLFQKYPHPSHERCFCLDFPPSLLGIPSAIWDPSSHPFYWGLDIFCKRT